MTDDGNAPGPGHNSGAAPGADLTADERRSLLLVGLGNLESLTEDKDEIVSSIRNERKRLVSYGFVKSDIDFALRLRRTDPKEEIDRRRRENEIAAFTNHPLGTQPDLFDGSGDGNDRTPLIDRARAAGYEAGLAGKPCDPGVFSAESAAGQAWIEEWHRGQAVNASMIKKLEPKPEPEPTGDEADGEDEA